MVVEELALARVLDVRSHLPPDLWQNRLQRRLRQTYDGAREILFDDASRFVFFSDCHRGDRSRTDAFAPNEILCLRVLTWYLDRGFTYIEVGDGDELWQNHRFRDVLTSHWPIFDLLHRFDLQGRVHLLLGNHDVPSARIMMHEKDGMRLQEGLVLRHRSSGQRIFVTHGHQADIKSDLMSPMSRFAVRHIWRRVQHWTAMARLGATYRDGGSAVGIERRLMAWARAERQVTIFGHTHRAAAACDLSVPYFNTGSFIRPGSATGLEIQGSEICLVRWSMHPLSRRIWREALSPPRRLSLFA